MKYVQLKCYRCGKVFDVIDMRYAAQNRLICKYCLAKGKPQKDEPKAPVAIPISGGQTTFFKGKEDPVWPKVEPMLEYMCTNCHYNFKRKKSAVVEICPYCSETGTLEVMGKSAEHLLSESVDRKFDS